MPSLYNLSGQVVRDNNDRRAAGCRLFFFQSGTLIPLTVYTDAAEAAPHLQHPVVADAAARVPAIYIPYSAASYRVRVTTASGAVLFDFDGVPNVDPATGSGGGGGGAVGYATGDLRITHKSVADTGYIAANGGTIGSASSTGATLRANDDVENIYIHFWTNCADAQAPVTGGRGASAAADWVANKTLAVPNLQERVLGFVRGMGGTATSLIPASIIANPTLSGAAGGAATHALTIAELAAHNHPVVISDPGHAHTNTAGATGIGDAVGGSGFPVANQTAGVPTQVAVTGILATTNNTGSGSAHPNVQPTHLMWAYYKL